jgi:hypothetical protein
MTLRLGVPDARYRNLLLAPVICRRKCQSPQPLLVGGPAEYIEYAAQFQQLLRTSNRQFLVVFALPKTKEGWNEYQNITIHINHCSLPVCSYTDRFCNILFRLRRHKQLQFCLQLLHLSGNSML